MSAVRAVAAGLAAGLLGTCGIVALAAPANAAVVFDVPAVYPSLSDAIAAANASSDPDVTIAVTASFAEPGTSITPISRSMQIDGNGYDIDLFAVTDGAGIPVALPAGERLRITDLGLVDSPGHALDVEPLDGGALELEGVEIVDAALSAIVLDAVGGGAQVRFAGGAIDGVAGGSGIIAPVVDGGSSLEVVDSTIRGLDNSSGSTAAVRISDLTDAAATVSGVEILDSDAMGVNVDAHGGATLEITGSRFDDVRHVAVRAALDGTARAELLRTTIARSGKNYVTGIVLGGAASFLADEVWVTGSLVGGVAVNSPGSANGASAVIRRTTIEDSAKAGLTAIMAGAATLELENSTITGNHGDTNGSEFISGLVLAATGAGVEMDVRFSTLVDNVGGPDLFAAGPGTVRVSHSVVGRTAAYKLVPNTPSFIVSSALGPAPNVEVNRTLVGTWNALADAAVHAGPGNLFDPDSPVDPGLVAEEGSVGYGQAALLDLGRPWSVLRPEPGSVVIDAGDPGVASVPATDQRGTARAVGAAIDLGALEAPPFVPAPPVAADDERTVAAPLPPPNSAPGTVLHRLATTGPAADTSVFDLRRLSRATSLAVARPARASAIAIAAAALLGLAVAGTAAHLVARDAVRRGARRLP